METVKVVIQFNVLNTEVQLPQGPTNFVNLRFGTATTDIEALENSGWLRMTVETARALTEALANAVLIAQGVQPPKQEGQLQ